MIIEQGGAVGDAFSSPTMLIYTSKGNSAPWSPSTSYGAFAKFTQNSITIQGSSTVVIGSGIGIGGTAPSNEEAGAYLGASKITLDPTYGVVISGIQVQRGSEMTVWDYGTLMTPSVGVKYKSFDGTQTLIGNGTTTVASNGSYKNAMPLGQYPRQRMLVEDPVTGEVMLGMAVYYRPGTTTTAPTSSTGYAGDLLVQY